MPRNEMQYAFPRSAISTRGPSSVSVANGKKVYEASEPISGSHRLTTHSNEEDGSCLYKTPAAAGNFRGCSPPMDQPESPPVQPNSRSETPSSLKSSVQPRVNETPS